MALNRLFAGLSITVTPNVVGRRTIQVSAVNYASKPTLVKPKPGFGISYRRIIHFPEKYTVKPLEVTNLAGRDPVSGRVVAKGIGGGIKHKYHWIDWLRDGPSEGPPQEEKVMQILECGCRTANVALVAVGEKLKYILATENMKAGDIIRSSRHLPRIPVRANEGDAYVLGALPAGTIVHFIEKDPGRLSNIEHGSTPIGSPQRNRWLGNRPRSGLWKRKDGRHGRKIKPPKPVKEIHHPTKHQLPGIQMTMHP